MVSTIMGLLVGTIFLGIFLSAFESMANFIGTVVAFAIFIITGFIGSKAGAFAGVLFFVFAIAVVAVLALLSGGFQ